MTDLTPNCALGAPMPRSRQIGAVELKEAASTGLASLAMRRGAVAPDLGFTLPGPGGWSTGPGMAAFWTGRDQWMIEFPDRAEEDVAVALARAAPGCSVTEQTDGHICIDLLGAPDVLGALMEKLVNLAPDAFGPGSATRTGLHHLSVFLIRKAEDRLSILGPRSAAETLWHVVERGAERLASAA